MPQRDNACVVEIKILDERVRVWGVPTYRSEMAAAIDLYACVDEPLALEPGSPAALVSAGISLLIGTPSIAALILPRSGLGHRKGLVTGNLVGVLDGDYTGPVLISAWNRSAAGTAAIVIEPGDRIAQLLFVPVLRPRFRIVDEFSIRTGRGAGSFGSTG